MALSILASNDKQPGNSMKLLRLILAQAHTSKRKFAIFMTLAAVSNVLLLAILNAAAKHAADKEMELLLVAIFALTIGIYILSQKYVWQSATNEISNLVHDTRVRIFNKIAAYDLENLEKTGKAELYAAINQHTYTLTVSALPIILSLQSFILIFFTLAYMAFLSFISFLISLIAITAAIGYAIKRSHDMNQFLDTAVTAEQNVYYSLTDLIEGFKEIKLNQPREEDLLLAADQLSVDARDNRITANYKMAMNFIGTQTAFYFLLAALVFLVPMLSGDNYPDTVIKVTTVGIFLISPITGIVSMMPTYSYAEMAVVLIGKVENMLDSHAESLGDRNEVGFLPIQQLTIDEATYAYHDPNGEKSFSMGPVSISIPANEITFITGGNGSGKSTLIKILLGLYEPNKGSVLLNGISVNRDNLRSYRGKFSTVLSDYHLFTNTYGLPDLDERRVDELLKKMGLADKTSLVNGHFDTLDLSTGQRKRLALIVAILEDRPIMVLDEWAADQDPEFRKVFYYEILPALKAEGKTVIAITHDEKYFDCSDNHFHMDEGFIEQVETGNIGNA